jgi:hypothetical protein
MSRQPSLGGYGSQARRTSRQRLAHEMKLMMIILVFGLVAAGCGRQPEPVSAGVPVDTNTVLPWISASGNGRIPNRPSVTTTVEEIVHEPSMLDMQEQERKRLGRMRLIDNRKEVEEPTTK